MEIGARGLRSIMEGMMTDIMYTVPSDETIVKIVINDACVKGEEQPLLIRRTAPAQIAEAE